MHDKQVIFTISFLLVREDTVRPMHHFPRKNYNLRKTKKILKHIRPTIKVCLHIIFSQGPLLAPLKFSIVPMVEVRITNRMGDGPILFAILMTIKVITDTA